MSADAWGVPEPAATTYWRQGDAEPPLPPHLDRPVLYAVGSLPWRVLKFHEQHAARAQAEAEAHRRRQRRLERADAEVVRCTSCGEWRMLAQPCEVPGCRSPWRLLATLSG